MRDYVIFTDATADLTDEFVNQESIHVIPMDINMDGEILTYCRDWSDEQRHDFFEQLHNGKTATTSQIPPHTYASAFEPVLKEGKDIVYICFSSGLSATIDGARLTAQNLMEEYPDRKIYCVDSLGATFGETLAIIDAAQCRAKGMSAEECVQYVESNVLNYSHWFTVDDLMFLKRGGRISATTAILGSALQIKPVMHVDDTGHLVAADKVRGRKLALRSLAAKFKELVVDAENAIAYISHGDCEEDAQALADRIRETVPVKDVVIAPITPVIGAHTGPGVVALFFKGTNR